MSKGFIHDRPDNPSFSRGSSAFGYQFDIHNKKIEIDYIESVLGHDGAVVSDTITHYYYILEGSGEFIIDSKVMPVVQGQLVEIRPDHSFDYRGQMKMLLIMEPPFSQNHIREVKEGDDL